jgi:hypothetical protein
VGKHITEEKNTYSRGLMMKKTIAVIFFIFTMAISMLYITKDPGMGGSYAASALELQYEAKAKRDLLCLLLAYPQYIKEIERSAQGKLYVVMQSGKKIIYDDKKEKSYEQKMEDADLQDTMALAYPLKPIEGLVEVNDDPGRFRNYALLKEIYGRDQKSIEGQLTPINVGGQNCQFSKNNGAAQALKEAVSEAAALSRENKRVGGAAFPTSGTYNYRYIAGTSRLSPHAFGIAIDLARDSRDYWQWATREQGQKRIASYPQELAAIFEEHNFVWGGKWGHFDILHFEYRPEIILKSKYFSKGYEEGSPWHQGAPDDENTQQAIEKVEAAFK